MKEEALKLADELEESYVWTSCEGEAADMIRKLVAELEEKEY